MLSAQIGAVQNFLHGGYAYLKSSMGMSHCPSKHMTARQTYSKIVRASEDEGANLRVGLHDSLNALLDKVVGARRVVLKILDQGHPHRAGLPGDCDVRPKFVYFQGVGTGVHGSCRGEQSDVTCLRERSNRFHCRADDAEYSPVGVYSGKVALLNGAESLRRGCVAGKNDQLAPPGKELALIHL